MNRSVLLILCLVTSVFCIFVPAQQKSKGATSSATRCHARIVALDGVEEKFSEKSRQELEEIRKFLDTCVQSYESLSKADLSKAAIELEWVTYSIDHSPDDTSAAVVAPPKDMVK